MLDRSKPRLKSVTLACERSTSHLGHGIEEEVPDGGFPKDVLEALHKGLANRRLFLFVEHSQ